MSTWNNSWKGNYWGGGGRKKAPKPQQPKRKAEKPHDELPAYDSDRWASSSTLSSSSRPSRFGPDEAAQVDCGNGAVGIAGGGEGITSCTGGDRCQGRHPAGATSLECQAKSSWQDLEIERCAGMKKGKIPSLQGCPQGSISQGNRSFPPGCGRNQQGDPRDRSSLGAARAGQYGRKRSTCRDYGNRAGHLAGHHRGQGESWATCKISSSRERETGDGRQVRSHELAVDCYADAIPASHPKSSRTYEFTGRCMDYLPGWIRRIDFERIPTDAACRATNRTFHQIQYVETQIRSIHGHEDILCYRGKDTQPTGRRWDGLTGIGCCKCPVVQSILEMFPYERPGWTHGSYSGGMPCNFCLSSRLCDFEMTSDVKTPENSGNGEIAIIHSGSLEGWSNSQKSMQHDKRSSGSILYFDWYAKNVRGCTLSTWFYMWDGSQCIPCAPRRVSFPHSRDGSSFYASNCVCEKCVGLHPIQPLL